MAHIRVHDPLDRGKEQHGRGGSTGNAALTEKGV